MKTWLIGHSRVLRHFLFWVVASVFLLLIQLPSPSYLGGRLYWQNYLVVYLPVFLLATYPLLYGLLPQLLRHRRTKLFLGLLAAWVLASALTSNLLWLTYGAYLSPAWFGGKPFLVFSWPALLADLNFGFFGLLLVAGAASAIKVFNEWYAQQQLSQRLRQRQLQAELQLLKAQLQPQFLFSTLGMLHALTMQKSPDSPAAVLHLSSLLRYMLYDGQSDMVPLADEVEMTRHYVALEQLRLGRQVEVSLNFSGALGQHRIAPLLLLPLVENAFRHGADAQQECRWVSIDLMAKKHTLTCKVIHSRPQAGPDPANEPDLRHLRERLAHLYPDQHELKMVAEPDTFLVVLYLRLAPAAAPTPRRPLVPQPPSSPVHSLNLP